MADGFSAWQWENARNINNFVPSRQFIPRLFLSSGGKNAQAVAAPREIGWDKPLETLAAEQLSYSHSDAHLEDKAKFINAIMTRKAVFKSLDFPDLTVAIVGNNAIVRHLWVSESELDGKVTNTKIGVLQVWQKQDSGWKLLARASFKLPQSA
jgi:hypothetical protein